MNLQDLFPSCLQSILTSSKIGQSFVVAAYQELVLDYP